MAIHEGKTCEEALMIEENITINASSLKRFITCARCGKETLYGIKRKCSECRFIDRIKAQPITIGRLMAAFYKQDKTVSNQRMGRNVLGIYIPFKMNDVIEWQLLKEDGSEAGADSQSIETIEKLLKLLVILTQCPHCLCMTKTIKGKCGKCKVSKKITPPSLERE